MRRADRDSGNATADLEHLVAEITTDARGDDEQLRASHQALADGVELPCDAFVIGEPVSVIAFDYDGNQRRGIVARCRRDDGSEHAVAASDVVLARRAQGGPVLAAYREWLGLERSADPAAPPTQRKLQHEVRARTAWEDKRKERWQR